MMRSVFRLSPASAASNSQPAMTAELYQKIKAFRESSPAAQEGRRREQEARAQELRGRQAAAQFVEGCTAESFELLDRIARQLWAEAQADWPVPPFYCHLARQALPPGTETSPEFFTGFRAEFVDRINALNEAARIAGDEPLFPDLPARWRPWSGRSARFTPTV